MNRRHVSLFLLATVYCLPSPLLFAQQPTTKPAATTTPSRDDLEKAFAAKMTNVVMTGRYTVGDKIAAKPDKYTIVSVRKLLGDSWLFQARVQFGDKDVTIPMIIPIQWAGDTPVISVTNLGFPGLGTYTARVVIYGDRYAGTWQADGANPHGGQLWGRIEKASATRPAGATQPAIKK
ncbi:MAG TPA: hypothetical protein VH475_06590 [Tepidisphaeraceae bacterium]|jgi:hypothetical protein